MELSLAALSNVNPNSYVVCWSDPVALLRYLVSLFRRVPLPAFTCFPRWR